MKDYKLQIIIHNCGANEQFQKQMQVSVEDLFIYSAPPPPVFFLPPVTNYMLFCNIARYYVRLSKI